MLLSLKRNQRRHILPKFILLQLHLCKNSALFISLLLNSQKHTSFTWYQHGVLILVHSSPSLQNVWQLLTLCINSHFLRVEFAGNFNFHIFHLIKEQPHRQAKSITNVHHDGHQHALYNFILSAQPYCNCD